MYGEAFSLAAATLKGSLYVDKFGAALRRRSFFMISFFLAPPAV